MYVNLYVPDGHEADFHVMFGHWLASIEPSKIGSVVSDGEDGESVTVERIVEGGLLKKPWDASEEAVQAAEWMLDSVVEKAHPLLKVFVAEPALKVTQDALADKVGWKSTSVKSRRGLFGKQAWRAGEWANPISSEMTKDGERVYFMRPATVETLAKAGL